MPVYQRYIALREEATYGTAGTGHALYLDLAGESLKRKPITTTIRPERRGAAVRQIDRGRSVAGAIDAHLGYAGLARVLGWLCSERTTEDLGSGAVRSSFTPDPQFTPPGLTGDVPRDVKIHRFLGLCFTIARMSFARGDQHFGLSLQALGADEQPGGSVPSVAETDFEAPAFVLDPAPTTPLTISISNGTTTWAAAADSLELSFGWNRKLRHPERSMVPTGILGGGIATASGRVRWYYGTDTDFLLDAFRSRDPVSLLLTMQGALIGGSIHKSLEVHLPACQVNGDPPTVRGPGAGNLDFSVDLEPLYSSSAGYPFRFRVTLPAPALASSSPTSGPATGGTTVTLTGTDLL